MPGARGYSTAPFQRARQFLGFLSRRGIVVSDRGVAVVDDLLQVRMAQHRRQHAARVANTSWNHECRQRRRIDQRNKRLAPLVLDKPTCSLVRLGQVEANLLFQRLRAPRKVARELKRQILELRQLRHCLSEADSTAALCFPSRGASANESCRSEAPGARATTRGPPRQQAAAKRPAPSAGNPARRTERRERRGRSKKNSHTFTSGQHHSSVDGDKCGCDEVQSRERAAADQTLERKRNVALVLGSLAVVRHLDWFAALQVGALRERQLYVLGEDVIGENNVAQRRTVVADQLDQVARRRPNTDTNVVSAELAQSTGSGVESGRQTRLADEGHREFQ